MERGINMKYSKKILSSLLIGTQVLGLLGSIPVEASHHLENETQVTTGSEQLVPENQDSTDTLDQSNSTVDSEVSKEEANQDKDEIDVETPSESEEQDNKVDSEEITKPSNEDNNTDQPTKKEDSQNQENEQPLKENSNNKGNHTQESTESTTQVTTSDVTNNIQSQLSKQTTEPTSEVVVSEIPYTVESPASLPVTNGNQSASSNNEPLIEEGTKGQKNKVTEEFIKKIGEDARKVAEENDLYASVMIAQAILESASGQSLLSQEPNYNLFGIKGAYQGKSVIFLTQEDNGDGQLYTVEAKFRKYETYKESLKDYAKLLKEGITGDEDFYSGAWKSKTSKYQEATKFLTGKYATDTNYHKKLNDLIVTYELTAYDHPSLKEAKTGTFTCPLEDYTLTSTFGGRGGEFHRGIDLAVPQGTPIYAAHDGIVRKSEYHDSWGNHTVIEHKDGYVTLYAHQAKLLTKVGEEVKQGQLIGYVGSTGNSTGPHLHFEVCEDTSLSKDKLVDPLLVILTE